MNDTDELFEKVVREGGKTPEAVREMIEKRKAATHGLLSDYGALYAVAKELGLGISTEKVTVTKLSEVKPKAAYNVAGRVKSIYPPKEFAKKDGGMGKIASLVIADGSGEARIVLWDGNADTANRVKRGDVVLLRNGYGKEGMGGTVEIQAGAMSNIIVNPKISIDLPEVKEDRMKIKDLTRGMSSVNLLCRVLVYYAPVEFKRSDGSEGVRASFTGEDETGKVRVLLWGDAAKKELAPGDYVYLENAYTKESLSHDIELHVGNKSNLSKTDDVLDLTPLPQTQDLKLGHIKPDMQGFSIIVRVLRTYEPRAYTNGTLASILVGDDTGTMRAVLWNEKSDIVNELKKGDAIRIKNAYAKKSLNGESEIHIGRYGEVIQNEDLEIASLHDIEKSLVNTKKIIDLQNDEKHVLIKGKIADIDEGRKLLYMTCSTCNKRVQNAGGIWFCESCNGDVEPTANLKLSLSVEDETGSIRAIAFKESAEKVLGLDMEEVMNIIGETQDEMEPIRQVKEGLIGKPIALTGRVKYSDFSDQLEFIVEEVEV
jgi:replication factor A1